jgi:hypothetical protein
MRPCARLGEPASSARRGGARRREDRPGSRVRQDRGREGHSRYAAKTARPIGTTVGASTPVNLGKLALMV